jgi:hypothetical protein
MNKLLNKLPDEIYREIYKYIFSECIFELNRINKYLYNYELSKFIGTKEIKYYDFDYLICHEKTVELPTVIDAFYFMHDEYGY